jgi:hypothetical protein
MAITQNLLHSDQHAAEENKRGLRIIQSAKPAAQGRWVGDTIRILYGGGCRFPRTLLHEIPLKGHAAGQKAVMGVRETEGRQEGEGLAAAVANPSPYLNPVTVSIVSLFAAAAMADDRRAITKRAQPREELSPVRLGVVLLTGT